jgi:hypothetical protein
MDPNFRDDDWGEDARRRLREAEAMAQDVKEDVQASKPYKGWKSWTPARRFLTVGLAVILIAFIIGLIVQLDLTPMVPGAPSGEGG